LPPPAPSAAGTPAAQSTGIDFATEPSPPRKGSNTVRVRLTGPDGKPLTGATVTATFVMPAMPAMGMGAQRAAATLAEQSPGAYSGPLQLGSGGAWQVTIAVLRGGQTVTAKQFSVDATGGM
jgi:Cu(I)/Ag(I) efflux system membrane fusion protein/cobalt-zinc-cadmium efflux system membrane fusion protein